MIPEKAPQDEDCEDDNTSSKSVDDAESSYLEETSSADGKELVLYAEQVTKTIASILEKVNMVEGHIHFNSSEELIANYKKYEEILLLKLIELDEIDAKSLPKLKEARRDAILYIQKCLKELDLKINPGQLS